MLIRPMLHMLNPGQFASSFLKPSKVHYWCGHSLGLQPFKTNRYVQDELAIWANHAVEGHFVGEHPWVDYKNTCIHSLATITGALASEVIPANSLTVNLHLMLQSFYQPRGKRKKIMIERTAFSSDIHALQTFLQSKGLDKKENLVFIEPDEDLFLYSIEHILQHLDNYKEEVCLLLFPGVQYLSGQVWDIESISAKAKSHNYIIGWDLAHAIGNVPLHLHDHHVDFAVWCSYKYLNAGPGAVGGYFVHEKHGSDAHLSRLGGWWGTDREHRFEMQPDFVPAVGAAGWQISNEPILSLAALRASLDIYNRTNMQEIFHARNDFWKVWDGFFSKDKLRNVSFRLITPSAPMEHGNQFSLYFSEDIDNHNDQTVKSNAEIVFQALRDRRHWVDVRRPNILRFSTNPLYHTIEDFEKFCQDLFELCKL